MIEKMKAVCVVSQNSRKQELLTALCDLGILHVAEKKTANSAFLERFSALSRLFLELNDYASQEDCSDEILTDEQFQELYEASVNS